MKNTTEDRIKRFEELDDGPLTFGQLLRSIRTDEGMSVSAFADSIDYTADDLEYLEADVVKISDADRVSRALGDDPRLWVELAIKAQLETYGIPLTVSVENT